MSSLENNKIFAAVLCAGITVMLGGFIANHAIPKDKLETDAVTIEGAADDSQGAGAASAPAIADPILGLIATADIDKGAKISKACAACHSFEKGGPNKQGPTLWDVVNIPKGSHAGFDYSDSLKDKGGEWSYESLNQFLWKPKKYIEGTKMNFAGIKKPEDRAALIAWLRQQADSQAPLPTDAEISANLAAFAPPEADQPPETEEAASEPIDAQTDNAE